jgi:hypothetical protein
MYQCLFYLQYLVIAGVSCIEAESDKILRDIVVELRSKLPLHSVLPSEKIFVPTYGDNSNCLPECTLHVDAFLYDDDDVEELVEQGQISRNFCCDCGSRKTTPFSKYLKCYDE